MKGSALRPGHGQAPAGTQQSSDLPGWPEEGTCWPPVDRTEWTERRARRSGWTGGGRGPYDSLPRSSTRTPCAAAVTGILGLPQGPKALIFSVSAPSSGRAPQLTLSTCAELSMSAIKFWLPLTLTVLECSLTRASRSCFTDVGLRHCGVPLPAHLLSVTLLAWTLGSAHVQSRDEGATRLLPLP